MQPFFPEKIGKRPNAVSVRTNSGSIEEAATP
jgi:hypothetical protein